MWREGHLKIRDKEHAKIVINEISTAYPGREISNVFNRDGDALYVTELCVPDCSDKKHDRFIKDLIESRQENDRDKCYRRQNIYFTQLNRIHLKRKKVDPVGVQPLVGKESHPLPDQSSEVTESDTQARDNDEFAEYTKRILDSVACLIDSINKKSASHEKELLDVYIQSEAKRLSLEKELEELKQSHQNEIEILKKNHERALEQQAAEFGPAVDLLKSMHSYGLQITKL
jgi:cell division protein FtsB